MNLKNKPYKYFDKKNNSTETVQFGSVYIIMVRIINKIKCVEDFIINAYTFYNNNIIIGINIAIYSKKNNQTNKHFEF